jgi:hypothetical protein
VVMLRVEVDDEHVGGGRLIGNFLPKQWMLDRIPLIGATLRGGTTIPPLNMICWESFYLIQKNESGK